MYEQWIKLKRQAEKGVMNPFDKKLAKITDNYRDKLKQVQDLYKQISGHSFTTLFPDWKRGETDAKQFYTSFDKIKSDLANYNAYFFAKYILNYIETEFRSSLVKINAKEITIYLVFQ